MGKSYTVHVVGYEYLGANERIVHCAMSRAEIAQKLHIVNGHGGHIYEWWAQTQVGYKILGDWQRLTADLPKLPKMVGCPVCDGIGCCICDWSGICRPNHWSKWQDWQLADIRKGALERASERGNHV